MFQFFLLLTIISSYLACYLSCFSIIPLIYSILHPFFIYPCNPFLRLFFLLFRNVNPLKAALGIQMNMQGTSARTLCITVHILISQIYIYYLLCIAAVNLTYTSNLEITTTRSRDCPPECICLSPKQVESNTHAS